jgi:diguanylate cyclase (GGDEF)-like protein
VADGHASGDQTLTQVAGRLVGAVRADDVIGRQSGDEFAELLGEVGGEDEAIGSAERILGELRGPSISARGRSSSAARSGSPSPPSAARPPRSC